MKDDLIAAAQQALEALENTTPTGFNLESDKRFYAAITALRDALTKSEQDWSLLESTQASLREHMAEIQRLRAELAKPTPSPEDLGYVPLSADGRHVFIDGFGEVPLDFEARANEIERAALAEPVQEPVALRLADALDRSVLELSAKAIGRVYEHPLGLCEDPEYNEFLVWNPLTDDGDALRLAVTLKMGIAVDFDRIDVTTSEEVVATEHLYELPTPTDPYVATRRAIVRAAAEIEKARHD